MKSIMSKWKDRLPNLPLNTEISEVRIILTLKNISKSSIDWNRKKATLVWKIAFITM